MPPVLRSPKWLAGHALALAGIVLFVSLGLWQLDRLEQRRAHNAVLEERLAGEPVAWSALQSGDAEELAYRRAVLPGTYEPADELLLSVRTLQGRPGHHVLTPLRGGKGTILVDRGWVPLDWDAAPVAQAAPPDGPVTVEGVLLPSEPHGRAVDRPGGRSFVTAVDLQALSPELAPVYLLATAQQPAQDGFPVLGEAPERGEGSHLSYAVQWLLFAAVVAVGYPLLLRRVIRDARRHPTDMAEEDQARTSPAGHQG